MAGNLQKNSNRARPVVVARARRAVTVRATFFPAHDLRFAHDLLSLAHDVLP